MGEVEDLFVDIDEKFALVADAGGDADEGAVVELEFDLFVEEEVKFASLSKDFGYASISAPDQAAIERPQNAFLNFFWIFRLRVVLVRWGMEVQGGSSPVELVG